MLIASYWWWFSGASPLGTLLVGWGDVQGDGEGYTTRHGLLCLTAALSSVHDGTHLVCLRLWRHLHASTGVQLGWWLSPGHLLKPLLPSVTTSMPCCAPEEPCQHSVGLSSVSSPSGTAVCHLCLPAPRRWGHILDRAAFHEKVEMLEEGRRLPAAQLAEASRNAI